MATDLTPLQNEVARLTEVVPSVVALLNGFADRVEAEKEDPVAVQAIVDGIRSQSDALAAAVTANTPAAPPAP